jgi:hypothetical protein
MNEQVKRADPNQLVLINAKDLPARLRAGAVIVFGDTGPMERAIHAAAKHAGQKWQDDATRHAEQFLKSVRTRPFMAEDLRAFAYAQGLPKPPSERAWGAVTMRLHRAGRIFAQGTAKVRNPKAHRANATSWSTVPPAP